MEGLPYYRVKLDDGVVQCALEELLELAAAGRVRAETLIIPPFSESWQAADTLIELSAHLQAEPPPADPWAAWDEMESGADEDEEEDWDAGVTEVDLAPVAARPRKLEPPSLPEANILPLDPPSRPRTATPRAPAQTPPPPARPVTVQAPAASSRGQVIAFPSERSRPATDGAYALAQDAFPTFTPPPPRPRTDAIAVLSYSVKWGRLIALLGAGLALLAMVWFYVHDTANTTFPPHPSAAQPSAGAAAPPTAAAPVPPARPSVQDSYAAMEDEIRQQMSMDLERVAEPGDLEDAMYIELRRAGLDVASAHAEVLEWVGRREDVPSRADFRIRLRSREGQLDRELGTAAIVIGKYIQRYSLNVPRFEVVLEAPGREPTRWSLDPGAAVNLYTQRITLLDFLNSLR